MNLRLKPQSAFIAAVVLLALGCSRPDDNIRNDGGVENNILNSNNGTCAYDCVADTGVCTGEMGGVVAEGSCSNNQTCCYTGRPSQCQGVCILQGQACPDGLVSTSSQCNDAAAVCCEDSTADSNTNSYNNTDTNNTTDTNNNTSSNNTTDTNNNTNSNNTTDTNNNTNSSNNTTDTNNNTSSNNTTDTNSNITAEVDTDPYIDPSEYYELYDESIIEVTEAGKYRVDSTGNITDDGQVFNVRCGNWFGLEGQHEPPDAENNPDGAPMELYVGNMWWADTGRDIQQTMDEIKELGINMIRLPLAPQTLDPNDPQGIGSVQSGGVLKNHESVIQDNARQALEDFIKQAADNDLKILLDIHSCSNYVGWRAGRLDAAPPYADADRVGYDFTREGYTCAGGKDEYNEEKWLANLKELAGFPAALGVDNIIGIDIFNEPWDYSWPEWKALSEKAFRAIDSVNKDLLIFVEGIGSKTSAGVKMPHGSEEFNPNWGENLFDMKEYPLNIPKERLVISPHTYGPSVFVQKQFVEAECNGLEGDAAAEAGCQINIDGAKLEEGWQEHFGYLRDEGYAMVMGEFGGNINWPKDTRAAEQEMWSHISNKPDLDWQNAFVDYMIKKNIQGCYWSINPESADTGGLYSSPYKADVNESAWGEWGAFDSTKKELILRYWQGLENR